MTASRAINALPARAACALAAILAPVAARAGDTAAPSSGASIIDGIAAEVDGDTITISEVMREARALAAAMRVPLSDSDAMSRIYGQSRDALIERLLILHAYHAGEQKLPGWVADNRMGEIIEERFGGDRAKLVSALAREHLTVEEWRDRLEEEIILGSMRQLNVDRHVQIRPGDVVAEFESSAEGYGLPGPVRVAMIMLAAEGEEGEEEVVARAAAIREGIVAPGGDFASAARLHSREAHAGEGGDWGFVDPEEECRPESAAESAALKVGEVSRPVVTPAGVYLLKKVAERPDRKARIEDVRDRIEAELREKETKRIHDAWIERLGKDARIRIYDLPIATKPAQPE